MDDNQYIRMRWYPELGLRILRNAYNNARGFIDPFRPYDATRLYFYSEQGELKVDYSRQQAIEGLQPIERASVIGLGGTGFWVALFLAMQGAKKLALYDDDKIELSNLARLPISMHTVGILKVEAARNYIRQIRGECHVDIFRTKIQDENVGQLLYENVFCCTDNLKSQVLIQRYCMDHDIEYQRCGYDGASINVSRATPFIVGEDQTPDGYTINPSWVVPAAISAALAVCSQSYKEVSVTGSLGKMGIINEFNINPEALHELRYNMCNKCARIDQYELLNKIATGEIASVGFCDSCDRLPMEVHRNEIQRFTTTIQQQRGQVMEMNNRINQYQRRIHELEEKERQQENRIRQLGGATAPAA